MQGTKQLFGLVDIILIIPFSRKLKENDKELNNCQDPWAPLAENFDGRKYWQI